MPKFEVTLDRTLIQYSRVPVIAKDADAAEAKIRAILDDPDRRARLMGELEWDDGDVEGSPDINDAQLLDADAETWGWLNGHDHVGVRTGCCPRCGHYGDDCHGRKP